MKEYLQFFREFRTRFETTGAIAPSSRFLARAITRPLADFKKEHQPVRVLEIGPGTGAFTGHIVKLLSEGDQFDIVEINESFAQLIEERFEKEADYQAKKNISKVHCSPLQEFETAGNYDFIISGLPLNNFPPELVAEFFELFAKLLKPGGVLSYFEYMFIRSLKKPISSKMRKIDAIIKPQVQQYRIHRDWVFANIPSAWAQHLQFSKEEPTTETS